MRTHYIAWFSAAGTTRQVADMLGELLQQRGIEAQKVDLSPAGGTDVAELGSILKVDACLWLGSPVYVDHAMPQIMQFIDALPCGDSTAAVAVPFVTWGAVCSGVALPEMAQGLKRKGWTTIAAAKVLAQHSSMWKSSEPLAHGHPDATDMAQLESLVAGTLEKLAAETNPEALAAEVLNYLPQARAQEAWEKSLTKAKLMLGEHQPQRERCDGCGLCVELCPVGALSWEDGYPVVSECCVRCHQCTRHCPQQAFSFNAPMMEERLYQMAEASPEAAETRIYL